jgi:hypothetical protein
MALWPSALELLHKMQQLSVFRVIPYYNPSKPCFLYTFFIEHFHNRLIINMYHGQMNGTNFSPIRAISAIRGYIIFFGCGYAALSFPWFISQSPEP